MSHPSLWRTFFGILLSCILVALQPCMLVLDVSSTLSGPYETNGSEDTNDAESDEALAISDPLAGRRVIRRSSTETHRRQLAIVTAQGVRSHNRPPFDRRAVVERVLPLRC